MKTAVILLMLAIPAVAADVRLAWDASADAAGYEVYRTENSGAYPPTPLNPALISGTTFTDTTAVAGTTYFYVSRAVSDSGLKSAPSNEVFAVVTVPPTVMVTLPASNMIARGKVAVLLEASNAARIELRIDGNLRSTAVNATRLSYQWNANKRGLHTINAKAVGPGWETEVMKTVTVQ